MKKLIGMMLVLGSISMNAFAYSEQECIKDSYKALQKSNLTSVYGKTLADVSNSSDTAKGAILGIQDTTVNAIENALKSYCKLQEQAIKNY